MFTFDCRDLPDEPIEPTPNDFASATPDHAARADVLALARELEQHGGDPSEVLLRAIEQELRK